MSFLQIYTEIKQIQTPQSPKMSTYIKKLSAFTTNPTPTYIQQPLPRKMLKHNGISYSPRKESSDGLMTCFETYPQNQFEKEYGNSIEFDREESVCPSIQNAMLDRFLQDLKEQIKLKSEALGKAQRYIVILQEELEMTMKNKKDLAEKLAIAEKKIQELQSELYFVKNLKAEDTAKKSHTRTKTYITERNIPVEQNTDNLKLISSQIFNEFVMNFESMVSQLSEWAIREREEEIDNSFLSKLEVHKSEVEDLLYGKSDDQYSKTTLETLYVESNKKKNNQSNFPSSYNEYEHTIDMYKSYCGKLQMLLCQSINNIQELSKNFQKTTYTYTQMAQPHILIPNDLMKIIMKQCKMLITRMFLQLKMQNAQLTNIVNQMIQWINKNTKDSPQFVKSGRH